MPARHSMARHGTAQHGRPPPRQPPPHGTAHRGDIEGFDVEGADLPVAEEAAEHLHQPVQPEDGRHHQQEDDPASGPDPGRGRVSGGDPAVLGHLAWPCRWLPAPSSPLGALWGGQDGVGQRHLAAVRGRPPGVAVVERSVGKEDVVLHTAQQEGGEGDDEQELPGGGGGSAQLLAPRPPGAARCGVAQHGTARCGMAGGGGHTTGTYTSSKRSESIMQAKPFFWWKW